MWVKNKWKRGFCVQHFCKHATNSPPPSPPPPPQVSCLRTQVKILLCGTYAQHHTTHSRLLKDSHNKSKFLADKACPFSHQPTYMQHLFAKILQHNNTCKLVPSVSTLTGLSPALRGHGPTAPAQTPSPPRQRRCLHPIVPPMQLRPASPGSAGRRHLAVLPLRPQGACWYLPQKRHWGNRCLGLPQPCACPVCQNDNIYWGFVTHTAHWLQLQINHVSGVGWEGGWGGRGELERDCYVWPPQLCECPVCQQWQHCL